MIELVFGGWVRAPGLWTLSIQRDFSIYSWEVEKYLRDKPMKYSRDYYGFRGNTHPVEALNMVTLGGSTTDEPDVSDEETWVAQFEQCLNGQGIGARIGNAGINGQSSVGHIRNFSVWFKHIADLKPKFFLAYVGINEPKIAQTTEANSFNDDVTFRDKDGEPNRRYGDGTAERYTYAKVVGDWISINSALYSLYKIVAGNLEAIRTGSNPRWRTELYYDAPKKGVMWGLEASTFDEADKAWFTKELADRAMLSLDRLNESGKTGAMRIDEYFADGVPTVNISDEILFKLRREEDAANAGALNAYRDRIRLLVQNIRAFGAQPILMTQPKGSFRRSGAQISGDIVSYIKLDSFNRALMDVCREVGGICVDLAAGIEFGDGDYWDWEHTTPQGSAKIGAYLCRVLTDNQVLTRSTFAVKP